MARGTNFMDYEDDRAPKVGHYNEDRRGSKKTRVQSLYARYKRLSRIEQYNFMNLIQNTPQ